MKSPVQEEVSTQLGKDVGNLSLSYYLTVDLLSKTLRDPDSASFITSLRRSELDSALLYDLLIEAIEKGDLKVVRFLIEIGANPYIHNTYDEAGPLETALKSNNRKIVQYLLDNLKVSLIQYDRSCIDDDSSRYTTSLVLAAQNGDTDLFDYLFDKRIGNTEEKKEFLNIVPGEMGEIMAEVIQRSDIPFIKHLLQNYLQYLLDDTGEDVLYESVVQGNKEIFDLLLSSLIRDDNANLLQVVMMWIIDQGKYDLLQIIDDKYVYNYDHFHTRGFIINASRALQNQQLEDEKDNATFREEEKRRMRILKYFMNKIPDEYIRDYFYGARGYGLNALLETGRISNEDIERRLRIRTDDTLYYILTLAESKHVSHDIKKKALHALIDISNNDFDYRRIFSSGSFDYKDTIDALLYASFRGNETAVSFILKNFRFSKKTLKQAIDMVPKYRPSIVTLLSKQVPI